MNKTQFSQEISHLVDRYRADVATMTIHIGESTGLLYIRYAVGDDHSINTWTRNRIIYTGKHVEREKVKFERWLKQEQQYYRMLKHVNAHLAKCNPNPK